MKNILAIKSTVSLANELKFMRISVYEHLHKPLVVDCTIAYDSVSHWMVNYSSNRIFFASKQTDKIMRKK